jgi:hypothetical protein
MPLRLGSWWRGLSLCFTSSEGGERGYFSPPLLLFDCGAGAWDVFEAIGSLEGQHPAGVFGGQGADFVELLEFFCGEF